MIQSSGQILTGRLSCLNPKIVAEMVRVGNKGDGGYIVPSHILPKLDGVISFGISEDWAFEQELAQLDPRIAIHAYDHTVSQKTLRRAFVRALRKCLRLKGDYQDIKNALATYKEYKNFFRGNVIHFEERVFNRIDNPKDASIEVVLRRLQDKANLLVKMDIEGGEYRVIEELLSYEERISLMVIEFHDTEPLRDTFLRNIESIGRHYDIVHLHGNNCGGVALDGLPDVLEMTFLNKRFSTATTTTRNRLPVPGLDFPNDPRKADYELVFA